MYYLLEIINYENVLIKQMQIIFGSPKNYTKLIMFGKHITRYSTHSVLLKITIFIYSLYTLNYYDYSFTLYIIYNGFITYLNFYLLNRLSRYVNSIIKNFFCIKRPHIINNKLDKYYIKPNKDKSKSYSFPSNSIQNNYIFYSIYFLYTFPDWIWLRHIMVFSICFFVGFIKMLRALHYPHDIIGAMLIGYCIFTIYFNIILINNFILDMVELLFI